MKKVGRCIGDGVAITDFGRMYNLPLPSLSGLKKAIINNYWFV